MAVIDRTRINVCLSTVWLVAAGAGSLLVIVADLALGEGIGLLSCLLIPAALAPSIIVLATLGVLKCETAKKRSLQRIGYTCPKCAKQDRPLFRCPDCNEVIEDLGPTIHGILNTHCECGAEVPAVDRAGLMSLDKVCRHCLADLKHSELGRQPEYRLAVVGATSSGKTNLMITSIWRFEECFAPYNGVELDFGDPNEEQAFRRYVERLRQGTEMAATVRMPIPKAFSLSLRAPDGKGGLLYLYDAAGEVYAEEQALADHPMDKYDGVLFLIDPFAEEGIRQAVLNVRREEEVERAKPAPVEASEILGRLVNVLERVHDISVGGVFPIAVAITKMDACGMADELDIPPDPQQERFHNMAVAADHAEKHSSRARAFLKREGLGNFIRIIESRFARVAYFPVSALGRSTGEDYGAPFEPQGVLAPFLWLCYQTDALSDRDTLDRGIINFHIAVSRCFRGKEGEAAQLKAWAVVAGLALVIIALVLTVDTFALLCFGGIPFLALALTDVCWYLVIVCHRFED